MNISAPIDVSSWSRYPNEQVHPMWWGILGLIFVEATVVAIFLVSFFYLWIMNSIESDNIWSLHMDKTVPMTLPTINMGLLLICAWSMWYGGLAMQRGQSMRFVGTVVLCTLCGSIALYLRWLQFSLFPFHWDESAYASFFWVLTSFHFVHLLSAILGTVAIGWLAAKGYYKKWRYIGVQVDTMYWYFVVASWAAMYGSLYMAPRFIAAGVGP
jgi:heme/copper-type cytochrome/quinol oxidase subunit 3